jgi:RNA polymerase sigma-70 factor, ECF subfamily
METQNRLAEIEARSLSEEWGLVQRAITGDRGSQDRLFTAHSARLYRAAFAVLRNKEDAEDAVQDGLYNAYTKLRSFQGRSSFYTWLIRIVINSALMTRRRKRVGTEASLDEILDNPQGSLPDGIVDRRPDPEEACGAAEINRLVDEQIRRLPVALHDAFQLREVDGFSTKESSRALGILEGSVKTRLFRARRKLTYELRRSIQGPVPMVAVVAGRQVDKRDASALQLRSYRVAPGDVPRGMRKPVR